MRRGFWVRPEPEFRPTVEPGEAGSTARDQNA